VWFQRFASFPQSIGFVESKFDALFSFFRKGATMTHLLLYVDDISLSSFSPPALPDITRAMAHEFSMKDLAL
jgi:hypothetical protein